MVNIGHEKAILVDAVDTLVIESGDAFKIFKEMHELLETFSNRKIILTNANDEQFKEFGLTKCLMKSLR